MAESRSEQELAVDSSISLTISIYQNSDQVAGLLQQILGQPLLVDEKRDASTTEKSTSSKGRDVGGQGQVSAGAPVPGIGSARLQGSLGFHKDAVEVKDVSSRSSQNFVYSQAYYLGYLRMLLAEREAVVTLADETDPSQLQVGRFVEFSSSFRPNELGALLDIFQPNVVRELVRNRKLSGKIHSYGGWNLPDWNLDKLKGYDIFARGLADTLADAAGSLTSTIASDFRTNNTREYYGTIPLQGKDLTAVVICDNVFFVVDDPDRMLDGRFTVLGKVVSSIEIDVPILRRNKILSRLQPKAVDAVLAELKKLVDEQVLGEDTDNSGSNLFQGMSGSDVFNFDFSPRIKGESIRILPIAIFA